MNATELLNYILKTNDLKLATGRKGSFIIEPHANGALGSFYCTVEIHDARRVFNRVDVLVQPVDGGGRQWVSLSRVKLFND